MKNKKLLCLWGLSFLISVLVSAPSVFALSCAEPFPVVEEKEYSDYVFKGVVIKETSKNITFEVSKAWKGDIEPTITLHQNGWDSYTKGNEYIVFAGYEDNELRPRLCGNSGIATSEIEQELGEPIPLLETNHMKTPNFSLIIYSAIGVIVFVGGLAFVLIKKKR